ncbi:MAG: hypothetical protein H6Q36_75 [Chloroflexi bacterium]|nr:hypothetical protein [Chloroflexota bacterium]
MCPAEALSFLLAGLTLALAATFAVSVLVCLGVLLRPAEAAAEGSLGRFATRHLRAHHGVAPDAPRWACRACHSVNEATATACYSCAAAAVVAAQPIAPAAGETFQRAPRQNRFDPSRYRGPGAPSPGAQDDGGEGSAGVTATRAGVAGTTTMSGAAGISQPGDQEEGEPS